MYWHSARSVPKTQLLLAFCLIGTLIAITGASLRTSNIQAREELGVLIHRCGMGVMLVGFGGMFLLKLRSSGSRKTATFQWSDVDGRLTVIPVTRDEILNLSALDKGQLPMPRLDSLELHGVRHLVARGREIDKDFVARLAKLQHVKVLDLQNAKLGDGVIQGLEALDCLEVLLLAGCLEPYQAKELRIALPEARMIFEPR